MKNKFLIAICAVIVSFSLVGCATQGQFLNTLGPPSQVQAEITVLGAVAKGRITNENVKAQIHRFAENLLQAGNLDTTQLKALVPSTGNPAADALVAAGVAFIDSAIAKVGSRNPTTIAYIKAVGNGLLAAGF